jgi:hypothetical protein
MGTVKPGARLDRHKTHPPCRSTIPKACNSEDLSGRGSEFNGKLSFGCSSRTGGKGLFPPTPDWDRLSICGDCQANNAEEANKVKLKFFSQVKPFSLCHVSLGEDDDDF